MKKACLIFLAAVACIASCTKTDNTTTNNIIAPLPAFTVNGVHDVTLVNGAMYGVSLPITVQYSDSAQEVVTLSLSALPAGITMDTASWVASGIPSFTSMLDLLDTTVNGGTPGTYPMTVTAIGATTGKRTFPFNIKIQAEQSCIANYLGRYANSNSSCTATTYSDSVYADATIPNMMWFTNFKNTGQKLYAKFNCSTSQLTVPSQVINGSTYVGTGNAFFTTGSHHISMNLTTSTGICNFNMN